MKLTKKNIERCKVYLNGVPKHFINPYLLNQQKCWNNLEKIKKLHLERLIIYNGLSQLEGPHKATPPYVKTALKSLTQIEYELQDLWKFKRDKKYHRFWEIPGCECPKLDNEDCYPHRRVINEGCPYHGEEYDR